MGKGVAAVLLARLLFADDPMVEWAAAVAGVAAIVGHNWSVFIGFTGGRGVATSAGALGAMSPWTIVILAPIVVLVIWRSRYVSLGSVTGALASADHHRWPRRDRRRQHPGHRVRAGVGAAGDGRPRR